MVASGPRLTKSKGLGELPAHVSAPDPTLYWSDNYVVLDFETTTLSKGNPNVEGNRIVLACWGRAGVVKHTFGSEYEQGELVAAIEGCDFIVAHNAKFELGWLKRCGVDLRKVVVYDTFIGEYVLGGNRFSMVQLGLDASLKRYGLAPKADLIGSMFKAGICSSDIPESWLLKYCRRDVVACEELFLKQREKLRTRGLIHLQYQRCLLSPCLADLESYGMQLDAEAVDRAMGQLEDDYAKITSELQTMMDGASPASTKQKAEFIFGTLGFRIPLDHKGKPLTTPAGEPSVAAPALLRLRPQTARQRLFLEKYNEWSRMHSDLTKYLRKFKDCIEDTGGALHATFNQCATRTHRLSSSGLVHKVQFQNLNRAFKPVFKARHDGWVVAEADGAQLEFRIAAHLGRDKVALADILGRVDIHSFTASIIGCSRQDAKPHTFKPLYGGTSGTDAEREYYAAFAAKYGGIAATQRGWTHEVLNNKKLVTEYGLIHYWPDCKMTQNGYIMHTTSIYNYPVQGFATAEIIPIALICAWHRMKDWQGFLVNTVHDSIIAELPPEEIDAWHDLAQQCLIRDCYDIIQRLYGISLCVPLGAGVLVDTHWASATAKRSEVVYEAPEELFIEAARQEGMVE